MDNIIGLISSLEDPIALEKCQQLVDEKLKNKIDIFYDEKIYKYDYANNLWRGFINKTVNGIKHGPQYLKNIKNGDEIKNIYVRGQRISEWFTKGDNVARIIPTGYLYYYKNNNVVYVEHKLNQTISVSTEAGDILAECTGNTFIFYKIYIEMMHKFSLMIHKLVSSSNVKFEMANDKICGEIFNDTDRDVIINMIKDLCPVKCFHYD